MPGPRDFTEVPGGGGGPAASDPDFVFGIGPFYDSEAKRVVQRFLRLCAFCIAMMVVGNIAIWFATPIHQHPGRDFLLALLSMIPVLIAMCCVYRGISDNSSGQMCCFSGSMGVCCCWNMAAMFATVASVWLVQSGVLACDAQHRHNPQAPLSSKCRDQMQLRPLANAAHTVVTLAVVFGVPLVLGMCCLAIQGWRLSSRMEYDPLVHPPSSQMLASGNLPVVQSHVQRADASEMQSFNAA